MEYTKSTATFSKDIRIILERSWDELKPKAIIIMYYPSTADSLHDDRTINNCREILKRNGYGGFTVYNIADENVDIYTPELTDDIIVAWGQKIPEKISKKKLEMIGRPVLCFGRNKNGTPKLPTMMAYDTKIQSY